MAPVFAKTVTDGHGNGVEIDETLETYSQVKLLGGDNMARARETNLGDL